MAQSTPLFDQYDGKVKLTSAEFIQVFKKYDKNGDGYIEKNELNCFLSDVIKEEGAEKANKIEEYRIDILKNYDLNEDGKISLHELSKVLPTEENFLVQFENAKNLHTVDFMRVWYHYDSDRSGYLEQEELKGFLLDLLGKTGTDGKELTVAQVESYTENILDLFDSNKDGKIELSELASIVPLQDNYLEQFKGTVLSNDQFEELFSHYDQDNNGYIEDCELLGFLRDVLEKTHKVPVTNELEMYRTCIMEMFDADKDGRLSKAELRVLLSK